MKELNKFQNVIFQVGGVLFLVGACTFIFHHLIGMILFTTGVVAFTTMQMLMRYDGPSVNVTRLRRQQVLSDFCFLLSAATMMMQTLEFGPTWARRNLWILILVIGCILQLYTAFRIPAELEKLKRMGGKGAAALLLMPLLMESCAQQQYNVMGTTNVTMLEGNVLYLKSFSDTAMQKIDSCTVQHGRIAFHGVLDSTQMVIVSMDSEIEMPMVLEEGMISMTIDDYKRNVTGSPLNDTLYNFIRCKTKLDNEMDELPSMESRLIMDGVEEAERNQILYGEAQRLAAENDRLVTTFIVRNSDNVLGPGVFMFMTSAYPFPQLNPQIEEIMFRAKPYFKNHPYVKSYMEAAKLNMEKIQTGKN